MPHIFCKARQDLHAPGWLRQRATGEKQTNDTRVSIDSMKSLKLESTLEGHLGCVNCLQWNACGDLLVSGSDDCKIILWNPFAAKARSTIETNHCGNIFSVKFIQDFSDSKVATCGSDGAVYVTNVYTRNNCLKCVDCHVNRVKRLEVHPSQPDLLWSAGEDGYILQYDLREPHTCNSSLPKNLLIDLKQTSVPNHTNESQQESHLAAKCLALNPMRDEMMAVGSTDAYVRLFDRRYMNQKGSNSCIARFCPDHLAEPDVLKSSGTRSVGTTYVTFSSDGKELLVNLHGEQIYLFNTHEPLEEHKSSLIPTSHAHDYTKRFSGHSNLITDIKEAVFFGLDDEFIIAGSDDGAFYIWNKSTTTLVKAIQSDMHIVNCLQPHPSICMLATSGIEPVVRLWSPIGKNCHDVVALEERCKQNQEFISHDPIEAMIMMLFPS